MAKAPEPQGLTAEELKRASRQATVGVMLCYSPLFVYLVLAMLNGWPI
jgi:hypothetical protein